MPWQVDTPRWRGVPFLFTAGKVRVRGRVRVRARVRVRVKVRVT